MPARTDIRDGIAEAYNVLSEEFLAGLTISLAKYDDATGSYNTLVVLTKNRFFEAYDREPSIKEAIWRGGYVLKISDESSTISVAMRTATHVVVGSTFYIINRTDSMPPTSTEPEWVIYCDHLLI